jgi:hypothetical protein
MPAGVAGGGFRLPRKPVDHLRYGMMGMMSKGADSTRRGFEEAVVAMVRGEGRERDYQVLMG